MAQTINTFSIKEVALSAIKGMGKNFPGYEYKTIFHSPTGRMEDTKMFDCLILLGKCYEFKFICKKEPITDELAPFVGIRDGAKTMIMGDYVTFVSRYYPILNINTTKDRVFVKHCGYDYEVTFVEKRGLSQNDT